MPDLKPVLKFIMSKEAPKGYGQIFGGAKGVPLDTDVSKMKLKDIIRLQDRMLKNKSKSTAVGGYQFLKKTLLTTIFATKTSIEKVWTPELQDEMAIHLMNIRGLKSYLADKISAETFANNLAKEWASLPVVTAIKGNKGFILTPGMSYYEGDKLNKAHHNPNTFLNLIKAIKK